jgi:hypothetical protein
MADKQKNFIEATQKFLTAISLSKLVLLLTSNGQDKLTEDFHLITMKIKMQHGFQKLPNYLCEPDLVLYSTTSNPDYEFVVDITVDNSEVSECYGGQQTYDEKRLLLHWKTCPLDHPLAKAEAYYIQQMQQTQQQTKSN